MFEFMTCTPLLSTSRPPSFVKRRMPAPYLYTPFPHCYQDYPAICLTISVPNFQPAPPSPPTKEECLAPLPSTEEIHPPLSPLLLYTAAVVMEAKTHAYPIMCQGEREREKRTLPLCEGIQLHPHECLPHSNVAICPTLIGT